MEEPQAHQQQQQLATPADVTTAAAHLADPSAWRLATHRLASEGLDTAFITAVPCQQQDHSQQQQGQPDQLQQQQQRQVYVPVNTKVQQLTPQVLLTVLDAVGGTQPAGSTTSQPPAAAQPASGRGSSGSCTTSGPPVNLAVVDGADVLVMQLRSGLHPPAEG